MKSSLLFSAFIFAASAKGATLIASSVTAPNATAATSVSFPAGTGTDWGYYDLTGTPSPAVTTFNATNTSSVGSNAFTVTAINGGSVRGPGSASTGSPYSFFDFNNGDPIGNATDARPTGVFNSLIGNAGATAKAGVSLTLGGFSSETLVQLWTFGYNSVGTLEVYVNHEATPTYSLSVTAGNPTVGKTATLFSFDFNPTSASDSFEVRYFMTSAAADPGSANLGFQAVAVSPIPEPASFALLALAGGFYGFRRRR